MSAYTTLARRLNGGRPYTGHRRPRTLQASSWRLRPQRGRGRTHPAIRASQPALMRGDTDRYRALVQHADDFTLMSPFGGTPTRGADLTDERWEAIGRFFGNGTFEQEVVQSYGSANMVVLAIIERCHVEVGGLPAQEWPLRVTLVYRREGSDWRLAHRHADPLVKGVSLEQAAALARGARQ